MSDEMMVKSLTSGNIMQIGRITDALLELEKRLDLYSEKGLRIIGLNLDLIEDSVGDVALENPEYPIDGT